MHKEIASKKVYLSNRVKVEPLINSWYAWSFLVSPITYSMVTKNLHMRVLNSYLRSPKQHAKALKNKSLKGGLFIDHQGGMEVINELVDFTKNELGDLIKLSSDIQEFSILLNDFARGDSLEELYTRLPESLQGRVELSYDLFNRPNLRFIEKLFYSSDLYKPSLQSISLSMLDGDERPFVLSSPRFESEHSINIQRSFNDKNLDTLFSMKTVPQTLEEYKKIIHWDSLNEQQQNLALTFITELEPKQRQQSKVQKGVRFKYFGHATVLIESPSTTILTDPIISYDLDGGVDRFSYKDLPEKIDYVVITHNHQDHVMLETLLQLRSRVKKIIVPKNSGGYLQDMSLKNMLETLGFSGVVELGELDTLDVDGGKITGLPFLGEHGDLDILSKLAFHINLDGVSSLFAADSNNIDPKLYSNIHSLIGNIDYIFIGMECSGAAQSWLYGPLYSVPLDRRYDQSRRLDGSDCQKAMRLIKQFNPKSVYIYAMGAEPWLTFISSIEYSEASLPITESDQLIEECKELGIYSERLFGMKEITA